jgi:hypothetical protein
VPRYRLRFTAESCLTNATDVTLSHGGVNFEFLFSKRSPVDDYLRIDLEVEDINNRQAQNRANSILLPPALDALSFATGTPMLLKECELILKDEAEKDFRNAIYVGHKKRPTKIALQDGAIGEASKLLQCDPVKLAVRWHRYALDRQLPLEQFIFNWLSFETLAGDAKIESRCPSCRETLSHCDELVTHAGSSKVRAAEIFCAANPATTTKEFTTRVWNTARNRVFHGRAYPDPAFMTELFAISQSLRKASEKQIASIAGVTGGKPNHRYEDLFRVFYFIRWHTADSTERFASDWPETILAARVASAEIDRVITGPPPAILDFLDYLKSGDW